MKANEIEPAGVSDITPEAIAESGGVSAITPEAIAESGGVSAITPQKYTRQLLEALPMDALDSLAVDLIERAGSGGPVAGAWPITDCWDGFGEIVEAMAQRGFCYTVDGGRRESLISVRVYRKSTGRIMGFGQAEKAPRAAAIAAILAVQEAAEEQG